MTALILLTIWLIAVAWFLGLPPRKVKPDPPAPVISGPLELVKVEAMIAYGMPCPNGKWLSMRAFDAYLTVIYGNPRVWRRQ